MKKALLLLAVLAFLISGNLSAQPSQGGLPYSFKQPGLFSNVNTLSLAPPDMGLVSMEDELDEINGVLRKVARSVFADAGPDNSGQWKELPNGDRIWHLQIHIPGALALGMYYSSFWLPAGAKLFVYNEDKSQLIGAFTEENNHESGLFSTQLTEGDLVNIELFEPSRVKGFSSFRITEIAYVYRDFVYRKGQKDFGDSDNCEVNINCPEGASWQDEKKGVARVFLKVGTSYGWCSGSLVNNCRQDCTPYFLTADHCGQGASTADLNQWMFYFNYEAPGCSNPSTQPASNTITGCAHRASGGNGGNSGSDFYLVEFNTAPGFNPYYNGWNRNNTASSSGVSIHHPSGDIQKISTYTSALISSTWGGTPNTHWRVVWASTTNGHGVTEGGSSGSPIFDNSGYIVGDLTGGASYCATPTAPDLYGKFSYSWDQNGTNNNQQLKPWLDPDNTGVTTLAGSYCSGTGPTLNANFTANVTVIPVGGTVDFTDLSTGGPTSWNWTFNGGTPAASTIQHPAGIQYNTAGTYTVELTVSDGTSSDTETKLNYIYVGGTGPGPNDQPCDTLRFPLQNLVLYSVHYQTGAIGYISGNNGYSDKAKADYFIPQGQYTYLLGGYFYFGRAAKRAGFDPDIIFNVWDNTGPGNSPGAVLGSDTLRLSSIVGNVSGHAMTHIQFAQPIVVTGPFYMGVVLPDVPGDTLALLTNKKGQTMPATAWEQWQNGQWYNYADSSSWKYNVSHAIFPNICLPTYNIDDVSASDNILVYPNPAGDHVSVLFGSGYNKKLKISVYNLLGELIDKRHYESPGQNGIRMDVSAWQRGMYMLVIETDYGTVTKKLTLVR
jgi:lysyl endopeptidase